MDFIQERQDAEKNFFPQKIRAAFEWWESSLINRNPYDIYLSHRDLFPRVMRERDESLVDFVLRAFTAHIQYSEMGAQI